MQTRPTLKITTGKYFSSELLFIGSLFMLSSAFLILTSPILAALLLSLSLIILFTDCRMDFHIQKGEYNEYLSTFGFRYSVDKFNFNRLEHLTIYSSNYSQRLNSRGSSTTIHFVKYNAYLIADGNTPIHLFGNKKKKMVMKKLQSVAQAMDLNIIDSSE